MSHDEEWWWWASRQGDLKTVDGDELRAHLGSGVLAADVLVWQEGWVGWLQAAEVADLAEVLPAHKVQRPVEPQRDESIVTPPKPPLDRYRTAAPPPKPQARKHTLLGLPTASGSAPAGPPRPATTPLRPGAAGRPPRPDAGRKPGAPPRPLSGPTGSSSRPPPPRRPSTRPLPPRRPAGRPPPPGQRGPAPPEAELLEIDVELEDVSSPAAAAPDATEPLTTKPDATASDATQPDASPAAVAAPPGAAPEPAAAQPKTGDDAGRSSVRPSLIISVGGSSTNASAAPQPEPIVPVASDPDHEAPTQLVAPVAGAAAAPTLPSAPVAGTVDPMAPTLAGAPLTGTVDPTAPTLAGAPVAATAEPIVPVPSDPDNELPTLLIPPVDRAEPIVPVPSDPDNELPTQVVDNSDLGSEFPTHVKFDAPREAPLPSWELPRDSAPNAAAAPPAPLPAFPVDGGTPGYPGTAPDPFAAQTGEAAPPPDAFTGRPPGANPRVVLVIGIVGLALVVLGVGGVVALLRGGSSRATAAASSSSVAGATAGAKAPARAACTLAKQATRLSDRTAVRVPPYLATAPGGDVALGFATTPTAAIGLRVDPASLDLTQEFSREGEHDVLGVVPLVRGKKLDFAVDRDGSPLRSAHTVDASPPFILGVTKTGVSRAIGYGEPETIWPGAGDQRITEPRVATANGVGHAVAFRRGGRNGEVRVGWLTPDGDKKTDLVAVKADGPRVGTPNVAVNDREVLVAFAARPSDDALWTVRLAHAALGKAPRVSQQFELPDGGPGGDAISPAVTGLPGGRWLIQWTEGKPGSRVVRAQTLDAKLQPIGKPFTLSPEGRDSGQGALWLVGKHALSVFLVRSDSGYELWGAGLDCP